MEVGRGTTYSLGSNVRQKLWMGGGKGGEKKLFKKIRAGGQSCEKKKSGKEGPESSTFGDHKTREIEVVENQRSEKRMAVESREKETGGTRAEKPDRA